MRSVTSYYNGPLFQKNMVRFWPIWSVYTLIWAFVIPMQFFTTSSQFGGSPEYRQLQLMNLAGSLCESLQPGVMLSAAFGLAAAMAVFSYLCFGRSACMMHSLPMNRKTLFCTNYLSGLAFLLLPNLAIFGVTVMIEVLYGCMNLGVLLTWLWVQSATGLFFFSFAAFCAMFTGNLLALPAFYVILNFLAVVLGNLIDTVLQEFYYGYWGSTLVSHPTIQWLTPVTMLLESCSTIRLEGPSVALPDGVTAVVSTYSIRGAETVLIYAAVAVVLVPVALWVYQIRHVESAGDVVAISLVRPLFKVGVAVCSGLCLGMASAAILGFQTDSAALLVLIVLWTVMGALVAEMLLRKSFRVLDSWKSAALLGAATLLLFTAVKLDWFGYENRVPDPGDVETIHMSSLFAGSPFDDAHYGHGLEINTETQIRQFIALHQAIVDEKDRSGVYADGYFDNFYITYTLKNGQTLKRGYSAIPVSAADLNKEGSVTCCANQLLQNRDTVRQLYHLDSFTDQTLRLNEASISGLWSQDRQEGMERQYLSGDLDALWKAVLQDFEEDTIGVRYLFDDSRERWDNTSPADLTLNWIKDREVPLQAEMSSGSYTVSEDDKYVYCSLTITLTPNAKHTLQWLEENADIQFGDELLIYSEVRAASDVQVGQDLHLDVDLIP